MFNINEDQITGLVTKCLMVAGGYVAGHLSGMLAAIGFDKLLWRRTSPETLHQLVRVVSGLIVAILVAILVFRGGGGGGIGRGEGPDNNQGSTPESGSRPSTPIRTEPTRAVARVTIQPIRVRILAGDEVEKGTSRFYVLNGSPARVDRTAVLNAVSERKLEATEAVVVVYEFGREAGPNTIGYAELATDLKRLGVQMMSEEEYRQFVNK